MKRLPRSLLDAATAVSLLLKPGDIMPKRLHRLLIPVASVLLVITATLTANAATARADLTGRITSSDGRPVDAAEVHVWTAVPKTGTSPFCPSCYADCGKRARSSADDGSFTIPQLDAELVFRLLVVRPGFAPRFVDDVDPAGGPITVTLAAAPPPPDDPNCTLAGVVVGPDGRPVPRATVVPRGMRLPDGGGQWGKMERFMDPLAVTDDAGTFRIVARRPVESIDLRVEARGLAPRVLPRVPTGHRLPEQIQLATGASVTVRLLKDGKPLPRVEVGLTPVDRNAETYTGEYTIGTDDAGRATVPNVPAGRAYHVFARMRAFAGLGAVTAKQIDLSPAADAHVLDAGNLHAVPGRTLAGRVVLADGKPVPPRTRLLVARDRVGDRQEVELDAQGRFTVADLPDEPYDVAVRVPGYHVSPRNVSFDRVNGGGLRGDVRQDVRDLVILLEPGPWEPPSPQEFLSGRIKPYQGPLRGTEPPGAP